ncbi:MAG: ABC transporter ATP-binding protein [Clostridia bacterium]|nr:ABC transporter ATP-binding protein [Clostridia bacterium]MBQ5439410.1 ABC transporter ATP-binding protein [Clostridia bacterium]
MKHLIELSNIEKYYKGKSGDLHVLKNISLAINRGEFAAITGSSGSGKSTLMNIIGCLDVPDSGSYTLGDVNIMETNDKKRAFIRNRKIGFIFQGFNLIHALTAMENVQLPLIYRGVPYHERQLAAKRALKLVGLENRLDHKPYELSGGQQQRVAIARAIASDPPVILADEPTGSLDPRSGKIVLEILTELNRRGRTVVIITHDESIAVLAKRRICIKDGKITV